MNKELEQQTKQWLLGRGMWLEQLSSRINVGGESQSPTLLELFTEHAAHLEAQSKPIQGEVDRWIPVANELPPIHEDDREDGFVLLLMLCASWKPDTWKTIKGSRVFGDYDEEGNALWFWADEDGDPIDDDGLLITYWQPIPPPPVSASPQ